MGKAAGACGVKICQVFGPWRNPRGTTFSGIHAARRAAVACWRTGLKRAPHLSKRAAKLPLPFMASRNLVLHFGYDELLSDARIAVLEDAGYEAIAVDGPAAALRVLRTRSIRLVMACHSVPPDELYDLLQKMKLVKPKVPVLVVHVGGLIQPQCSPADGFIDGLRGPEHLLSRVAACIAGNRITAAAS
jgi:hypothetical protein